MYFYPSHSAQDKYKVHSLLREVNKQRNTFYTEKKCYNRYLYRVLQR